MGLKERLSQLKNEIDKTKPQYENIKNETLVNVEGIVKNNVLFDQQYRFIRNQLVENLPSEDLKEVVSNLSQNDKTLQDTLLKKGYEDALYELQGRGVAVPQIENKSLEELQATTQELFQNENNKQILNAKITLSYQAKLFELFDKNQEIAYDQIAIHYSRDQLKEIEEKEQAFDPSNYEKREHITRNEKELNELITNAKTQEEKDALNFIKDEVLVQRNREDYGFDLKMSESVNSNHKKVIKKNILENQKEDSIYKEAIEDNEAGFFQKSAGLNKIDRNKLDQEIIDNDFALSQEKKDFLKQALHYLESMKNYKDGSPLFKIEEFKSEESTKVYGFKNIAGLYDEINQAVTTGNTENIAFLTEQYKQSEKELGGLIDILKKIDTPLIPGNISLARNDDIPAKYSESIKETSMVNGLWQTLGLIKATGISIDEFVEHPAKAYVDFVNKDDYLENEIGKKEFQNEGEFLNQILDGSLQREIQKPFANRLNVFRGYEFLASLDAQNSTHNYEAYQVIHNAYMMHNMDKQRQKLQQLTKPTTEKIKNFILTGNKTQNYIQAFNNTRGYELNLGIVDSKELLDKLNSYKNHPNREVQNAVKSMAQEYIAKKGLDCKEYNQFCSITGKMGYKAFKDNNNTQDIALSLKDTYKDMAKDGLDKDNMTKACNYLKILDEQYNKRNWFGKHFRKEGREEKKLIDQIKKDMSDGGISLDDIEGFLKGEKSIDDLSNVLEQAKELGESVEQIEILELDENQQQTKDKQQENPEREQEKQIDEIEI